MTTGRGWAWQGKARHGVGIDHQNTIPEQSRRCTDRTTYILHGSRGMETPTLGDIRDTLQELLDEGALQPTLLLFIEQLKARQQVDGDTLYDTLDILTGYVSPHMKLRQK